MKRKSRRPWLSQSCSSLNIRTKVHQGLFCSTVYIKTLLVADMNTLDWLEAFHMRCQRQILDVCWTHSSNAKLLQWSGLSTIGDILRHRRLICLAMLHAWTLEYQHVMLCVWWWIPTEAETQWPAGEDHRLALATSVSTRFGRMQTLYCCGDLRLPWVTERRNGSLELRDDDDDDEGCSGVDLS